MTHIERLERKIDETEGYLADKEAKLAADPGNFAQEMSLSSLEDQLEQLQRELRQAKEEREKEIVDLAFRGKGADWGSMRLHMLGPLMTAFSSVVHHSCYFQRHKKALSSGPMPADILEEADLRMAGLEDGSSKVVVTGKLSPNLFGNSLLEDALEDLFAVLRADSEEKLTEAVSDVGIQSVNHLQTFLEELDRYDLELEMWWDTPRQRERRWDGSRRRISKLRDSLGHLRVDEQTLEVEGTLVSISRRGRVEIEVDAGDVLSCSFPDKMLKTVRRFHIEDRVWSRVVESTTRNMATGRERQSYRLERLRYPEEHAKVSGM